VARIGTTATFGYAGAICAVWGVRIPALTDKLRLDPAELGSVILVWGVGAMLTMQATRHLLPRTGSRLPLMVAVPATAVLCGCLGVAPGYGWLLGGAFAFGAAFGVLDVGMNAQAGFLERLYERPSMSGVHAGWSVGSLVGGGCGALAAYAHWSFDRTVVVSALVWLPITLALITTYLPDRPDPVDDEPAAPARLPRMIYLIGAVTCATCIIAGAVANWSGLYLLDGLHATETVAAIGYPVFAAAMLTGRTFGDRVRLAVGTRPMFSAGGLGVAAGMGVVLLASDWPVALLGFFLTGLAASTMIPLAFPVAGADPTGSGAGIAQTGATGYAGLLVGPAAIGLAAEVTSLRTALLLVVVLGLLIAALGRRLPAVGSWPGRRARVVEVRPGGPARR
jgi:MFS family permease